VLNARTQARSAGLRRRRAARGGMELRFMAGNADVQVGDELPPAASTASTRRVCRWRGWRGRAPAESGFARILLAPKASADGVRHVLVLEPLAAQLPPRPEEPPSAGHAERRVQGRQRGRLRSR
jgi:rod shape-determining protein MreC